MTETDLRKQIEELETISGLQERALDAAKRGIAARDKRIEELTRERDELREATLEALLKTPAIKFSTGQAYLEFCGVIDELIKELDNE